MGLNHYTHKIRVIKTQGETKIKSLCLCVVITSKCLTEAIGKLGALFVP